MKKLILLFTIVCAGQMYGMEAEKGTLGAFEQLPRELRQGITQMAIASSTTIDEAIKAIQDSSMIYGGVKLDSTAAMDLLVKTLPNNFEHAINAVKNLQEGSTLKNFTQLVHALADKFHITTFQVAQKMYRTRMVKIYLDLGNKLLHSVRMVVNNLAENDNIIALINDGADVNFSRDLFLTPLYFALNKEFNVEVIETLLDAGAKPTNQNLKEFNSFAAWHPNEKVRKSAIKQLLEEAMKK